MRRPLAVLLAAVIAALDPALRAGPFAARAFADSGTPVPVPSATPPAAEPPRTDAATAVGFLEQNNVFKGPDDPLRSYIVGPDHKVTAIGEIIYQYFRTDTRERLRDFQPTFEQIRQQGPATPQQLVAAERAQADLRQRFGDVFQQFQQPGGGGQAHSFVQNALLSVSFDGAARARPEAQYTQLETEDAYVFMDKDGVAVRMAKNWACRRQDWSTDVEPRVFNKPGFDAFKREHETAGDFDQWQCGEQGGVTMFSRDLQKSQQQMNRAPAKPRCAPNVPETGRYNPEMLQYSSCLLSEDVNRSRRGYNIDLMVKLATLIGGKNLTEEMLLKDDGKLLDQLKAEGKAKKLNIRDEYCGRIVTDVLDLATCKLAKRDEYVKKAEEFYLAYKRRVEAFKGREVITQSEIQGLQADEALVKKYLTLAYLEAQRGQAYTQLEGISWEVIKVTADGDYVDGFNHQVHLRAGDFLARAAHESPDSKAMREALEKGPMSAQQKREYLKRAGEIAERVRRLMVTYGRLETELLGSDHAGSMGIVQGGLAATQRELGEVGLDARLYTSMPVMLHLGHDENSGWSRSTYYGIAKAWNWLGQRVGLDPASGYIRDRDALARYMPILTNINSAIARGDFTAAREAVLQLDPDAQRTHWQAEGASSGDDPTRAERTEAQLRKLNETVTGLMKTHMVCDIFRDIVVSSVVLAVAAPAMAAVASGMAKTAYSIAKTLETMGRIGKAAAFVFKVAGGVAEHAAIRLQSLSPAANTLQQRTMMGRVLTATAVRGINAGVRSAVFSLGMSGGVSGGINWAIHELHADSPYRSGGQAFWEGWKSGAKWGASNTWVQYVGLPNTAFEGTWFAPAADSLANRGLVGNGMTLAQRGVGMFTETGANWFDRGLGWAMSKGTLASAAGTTASMADQFAKYYAFNKVVGAAGEEASWRFNSVDGNDVERRIKRAQQAGLAAMDMPYWALIPTFSARTAAQVEQVQRANQGFAEYKKAGELDRIANAAADIGELPLKETPQRPFLNRMFEFNLLEATGEKGTFKVTKEMKYEAIRLELQNAVSDGHGGPINPAEYFRVSQMENGMAGRLHVTDEVRDQAQGLFEQAMLTNPTLAERILSAQAGSKVEGFGRVRLAHQEEVARVLFTSDKAGTHSVPKAQLALAEKILGPYLETEQNVANHAQTFLEGLREVKSPSVAYQELVDGMLKKTQAWKNDPVAQKAKSYVNLIEEFRGDTLAKQASLSGSESTVLGRMMDYITAIDARFNHFNHVGTAAQRAESALVALRTEATTGGATSPRVAETLDLMMTKLSTWKNAQASQEMPVGKSYQTMVAELKDVVKALDGKLTAPDMALLKNAVQEMQASPALLRNVKGDGLMGWRPEQFEGLMHFMRSISLDGAQTSEVIRTFLLMKTGGGKTMLSYEGLLPIAEADATMHGGKKLKTIFLTVQSNLEAQARVEYRAAKKLLSNLEIDTWEGFKSKLAQNKLIAKGGADEYWILGDEMDGAALQPALTIGETTAGVGKENSGYRGLKNIGDRMKEILDRGPAEVQKSVETQVRRQQSLVDSMEPGETQTKLRASTEELIGLSDKMTQLQRRGDAAGLERLAKRMTKVLATQETLLSGANDPAAKGVLEAGRKIADVVENRASVGRADWALAKTLFGDMLREQEALANQTLPLGNQQAKALEKVARNQRAAGDLEGAAKTEAQAKAIRTEALEARSGLDANAARMRELLKEGKPGWELEARQLIKERSQLVERSVVKENPIYETFRRMREDMYGLVNSQTRVTQVRQTLAETPGRTAKTLEVAADQLLADATALAKKMKASAAAGPEGQAVIERADKILSDAQVQSQSLRQRAAEVRARLDQPLNAEHQAAYEAREQASAMLARSEEVLILAKSKLKSAGPNPAAEVTEGVKTAEAEVARWRGDAQKANARVSEFEGARLEAARTTLAELRTEMTRASEGWAPKLQGLSGPEADAMRRGFASLETSLNTGAKRLEWTPEKAVDVLQRRIAGVSTSEYVTRTVLHYTGAEWLLSKVPGVKETRFARTMTPSDVGLTRTYARQLLWGFMNDPFMPPQVRWKMIWSLVPSTLMPRGLTGRGSSWVLTELLNLATGYTDNPANIRMDNITGRVNVVHNGQWFDSMDTPTRRFWEIEYGSDLTLPYEHKTMVTINDITRNLTVRGVGFSGTAGPRFRSDLAKNKWQIAGVGSQVITDVPIEISEGPAGKMKAIGDAVREGLAHDAELVALGKQADSLVVLSLPDTRAVREVRNYLLKMKILTPDQIAMVFSDSELLRLNRPEANVAQQMNLTGLDKGKVKLLILDTRVGGRGLDLNFKGVRNPGPNDFGGYFKFKMLMVDPQLASEAHAVQAQGRIDLGRIHSNVDPSRAYHPEAAVREFSMVLDLQMASKDPVFMSMLRDEPIFQQLSRHPRVVELAYAHNRFTPAWIDIHNFIVETQAAGRDGFVVQRYEDTVRTYLIKKQTQIELDQLRSAGVLQEAGGFDPFMYGLSPVLPGTAYPMAP